MSRQHTPHRAPLIAGSALFAASVLGVIAFALSGGGAQSDDPPLSEKEEIATREALFRAGIYTPPPPEYLTPVTPNHSPTAIATRQAGAGTIIESSFAPYSSYYTFKNRWIEKTDERSIVAYAGAITGESAQGILIVNVWTADSERLPEEGGYYFTPQKAGPIRITDAEGEVLTLITDTGVKFLFDVASRHYLDPDTLAPLPPVEPPATPTPTPDTTPPLVIGRIAIDTDVDSPQPNTATQLGARQTCGYVPVGGTLTIDVIVDAVPSAAKPNGGVQAFQLTLKYDPSKIKVVASDHGMLLAVNDGSQLISAGNTTPDSDGSFVVAAGDLGSPPDPEDGEGVLARITLEGLAPGVSDLALEDVIVVGPGATKGDAVSEIVGAQVAVGTACP